MLFLLPSPRVNRELVASTCRRLIISVGYTRIKLGVDTRVNEISLCRNRTLRILRHSRTLGDLLARLLADSPRLPSSRANKQTITHTHFAEAKHRENEEAEVDACLLAVEGNKDASFPFPLPLSYRLFIIHNHNKYSTRRVLLSCNRSYPLIVHALLFLPARFLLILTPHLLPHAPFRWPDWSLLLREYARRSLARAPKPPAARRRAQMRDCETDRQRWQKSSDEHREREREENVCY